MLRNHISPSEKETDNLLAARPNLAERFHNRDEWNDIFWLFLWVLQLMAIFTIPLLYGRTTIDFLIKSPTTEIYGYKVYVGKVVFPILVAFLVGFSFSGIWLQVKLVCLKM